MRIQLLTEAEFREAAPRWDALLARSRADSFFLRHRWLSTWWSHFGHGKELLALEVRDGVNGSERLIGYVPLCIARVRRGRLLPVREAGFLGRERTSGDYLDLVALPGREGEVLEAVLAHLLEKRSEWDLLALTDVPDGSSTLARILHHPPPGILPLPGKEQVCPFLPLAPSWETFLAGVSPNLRSNLRRREKRLAGMGARFVDRAADPATVPQALDSLFSLHGARWSTRGQTGNFVDPRVRAFHRELAPLLAGEGTLGLWTVEMGPRVVAAIYGFRHRERFLYYQAGFDPELAEHGVGLALMGHAIRESIGAGLTEFDYLRGDEEYKRRWTRLSRRTHSLLLSRGPIGWAWRWIHRTGEVKRLTRAALGL